MNPSSSNRWRTLEYRLVGLAVVLTLIGLFYTVELWRGKSAWEKCKRDVAARGISPNWADYLPAPVPDDENVFGVPQMQKWFCGRGATELSEKLSYPAKASSNSARLVVAELKIQVPGVAAQNGATVVHWGDVRATQITARLIKDAIGPVALHPRSQDLLLLPRPLGEVHPAQIVLECQTAPTTNELLRFLPSAGAMTDTSDIEPVRLEPVAGGYKASLMCPESTSEFLKWNERLEPEFALIRSALQRPAMRMNGDYTPILAPVPNFVTVRVFAQSLSAMAECHLLQGKPDDALADLTLIHDICRTFTNRPVTLVGAMINVAVAGLYAQIIADGLRWHAWREPQLAVLEQQLEATELFSPVRQAFMLESVACCQILQTMTPAEVLGDVFGHDDRAGFWQKHSTRFLSKLVPHGWIYQNMVVAMDASRNADQCLDPVKEIAFPKQVNAGAAMRESISHRAPYSFLAARWMANLRKACQTAALRQVTVVQSTVACALERYRLARGEYPATLDALAPRFISTLPHDVIGGQPLHYRVGADNTFLLYSVGWNGVDDGGVRGKSESDGDWVWPPTE